VLAPGCPPACHESGRTYQHVAGPPITETPVLTDEEVETLLRCARALNRHAPEAASARAPASANAKGGGLSPGDDFDRPGWDWSELLTPHGWRVDHESGGVGYWTRPGKDRGVSASVGHCRGSAGEPLFYCFTTNADPFGDGKTYGRFRAYAVLNHQGDLSA